MTTLVAVLAGLGVLVAPGTAAAAPGDLGFQGPSFAGAQSSPTADKAQSKLWFAHGSWWAVMFHSASGTWHIFKLDRATQQWIDTGVQVDNRKNTSSDVLWDGTYLYVASHVVTVSSNTETVVSQPNSPARLYRYSWSASRGYTLDRNFPSTITTNSSESMTLDKDSTGTVWATWTEVRAVRGGGHTSTVFVNSTTGGDNRWGTPMVVPVDGSTVSPDDISTVVAFGRNRIGVLWTNQVDDTVYWAVHDDGAARTAWRGIPVLRGPGEADDHVNIKSVQADSTGRVFAVVKTELDGSGGRGEAQIRLLSFQPSTGSWSSTTVGTVSDCHTRPLLMLDEGNKTVHVFATAPTTPDCPYSGAAGTIYDKTARMDNPVFTPGRGTPVIRNTASATMNDVTSTKQSITAQSGIVVLASNTGTQRYWHADLSATAAPQPVTPTAAFTTSVTGGEAPLPVKFTDTSTGNPATWAWNFGDGATSTERNPSHTYAAPGTYEVTLTVGNGAGTSTPATTTVTVTPGSVYTEPITSGASSTATSAEATTELTVPRPDGVQAGDLLVAQLTSDGSPTMATVPEGWTPVLNGALNLAGSAKVWAYAHQVVDPSTEPAAYTWQLGTAQKWSGGMTAFSGVHPTTPFDSEVSTKVDNTYAAAKLTVPGVTTVTPGAKLIGGIGLDTMNAQVTPPAGWTENWEAIGGQVAELAHRSRGAVGATDAVTWTLDRPMAAGGWVRALKPATEAVTLPAPTASINTSTVGGQAPLPVQFTGTATGTPTVWEWNFGDGTRAYTQNPSHTYAQPGTYTVTLTAGNAAGRSEPVTTTITVTPAPVSPTASITASTTRGKAPLPVTFTGTGTANPTAWAWDFGDGTTATTQNPSHTYTKAGTYTVTLVATNEAGASAPVTTTITVTAAGGGQTNVLQTIVECIVNTVSWLFNQLFRR